MPRKVVVFSCGGGSFFEYEQVKALNTEKTGGGQTPGNAAAQGDDQTANGTAQANRQSTFFEQIIYGTDHVFSPTQFLGQLQDMIAENNR